MLSDRGRRVDQKGSGIYGLLGNNLTGFGKETSKHPEGSFSFNPIDAFLKTLNNGL
jgi:hypothetical protein